MAEEILIKIEIEKGENEKQIDDLTKKITNLQAANHSLQNEQKELIKQGKQNSEQYIENSRQIEINKQKINESASSRKNLITTIIAEDNSIKGLRARNAELIKQRDQLSTATEEGRRAIAEINQELDKNNKTIKDNVSAQEKQRLSVGGYTDALDKLVPGLGATVNGINAATKAAWAFIATPLGAIIGALGLAIAAIVAYFKSSETAQNRWNKIAAVGSAILEQFMNVVENLGGLLVDAFTNPRQALVDFGNFLKENLINRFIGLLELIPNLGKAVELLFEGEFAQAGQVALDAVVKVGLGVENATAKIQGLIETTAGMVEEGIRLGEKIAALNAAIDAEERRLIVERDRLNLEVSKKRQQAVEQEGEQKRQTIKEAIALEKSLSDAETELARKRLALRQVELQANGDDKEALKAVAEARAAVFRAEATAFDNTLKFRKQLEALDEEEKKKAEKAAEDAKKLAEDQAKDQADAEKQQFENNVKFLEEQAETKLNLLKEQYTNELITKEEFEAKFSELELQALIRRKDFLLANGEETLAAETAIIDKKLEIKLAADAKEKKSDDDRVANKKKALDNEKAITSAEIGLLGQFGNALTAFAGKNKALAIAGIIIQKAAAIAQIIANTAIANAKAAATFWITGGLPWTAINTAVAALSIGSVIAEAATSISAVNSAKRGAILKKRFGGGGGLPGGILRGPLHRDGGIPFRVAGQSGFEAEGGEAIINRNSTRMFRKQLSAINQAGGGVPFESGGILGNSQTQIASGQAMNRSLINDAIETTMRNLPPVFVTVEAFNAVADEVATTQQRAQVIP